MKTYIAISRIILVILLVGMIIVLGIFYFQNWKISSNMYVIVIALAAVLAYDLIRLRK